VTIISTKGKLIKMLKEVKKITLGLVLNWIFGWIFGILFLFMGFVMTFGGGPTIYGILIIFCSFMIIPYTNKITKEKFNFHISG